MESELVEATSFSPPAGANISAPMGGGCASRGSRVWYMEQRPQLTCDGYAAEKLSLCGFKPLRFGGCLLMQHNLTTTYMEKQIDEL